MSVRVYDDTPNTAGMGNLLFPTLLLGGGFAAYWFLFRGVGGTISAPPAVNSTPAPGALPVGPRGIRNNNPTNIKFVAANNWTGQIGSDGTFAKFDSPTDGLRAAFKLLRGYCNGGYNTIRTIAQRWADSPPPGYYDTVSSVAENGIDEELDCADAQTMIDVVNGIVAAENGKAFAYFYSPAVLLAAYNGSLS